MVTAYRWLRRKTTDLVIAIPDTNGELTQDPERVAEGAMRAWAELWRAHQEAHGSFVQDSLDDTPLPALTVQDLRACLAQPAGQGKGVDSWTGAELKSLPHVALQGVGPPAWAFRGTWFLPSGCTVRPGGAPRQGSGGPAFEPKKHWHTFQRRPCVV